MMKFSPNFVETLFIKPLRYFFKTYAPEDLLYNDDAQISKIDISSVSDFNKEAIQVKPRIIVDRGYYTITPTGLTDNLAEQESLFKTRGLTEQKNFVLISGQAKITIEARNRGTCELVTDIVTHFFAWSNPFICNSQGFKKFSLPMQVSECGQAKDDLEIFQVNIGLPYVMEELWEVRNDALKLKDFYKTLTSN